jgi:hypothetical protein
MPTTPVSASASVGSGAVNPTFCGSQKLISPLMNHENLGLVWIHALALKISKQTC